MPTTTHGRTATETQRMEAEARELGANAFKITMFGVVAFCAVTWFVML